MQHIVLRKIAGRLEACRSAGGAAFRVATGASAAPSLTSLAFALALVLVLPLLALGALALLTGDATPLLASGDYALAGLGLAGTVSNELVEKRERFAAKQQELKEVFEAAGRDLDMSRKAVLEKLGATDSSDAVKKIKDRNLELDALSRDLEQAELKAVREAVGTRETLRNQPSTLEQPLHPAESKARSWGELVAESKEYKAFKAGGARAGMHAAVDCDISLKTLMQVAVNGFPPESVRTGLLVEGVTRPIQILDLIPVRQINQAVDKYMEETTRTHAAAETSEGAAYQESTFVWTERTQAVEKITDSIPVTDEQLEDEQAVSGLIDQRLRFGLRQRLDLQVLVGDGTSPNLSGILDRSTSTQAKGSDPVFDAVFKALTKVRFTGRAMPNALVFHPNDWQDIRLTRTADGQYIMGNPSTPGATTLFGLPVAISDAITENTGLAGDFANFCYIGERRGIQVQVGYVGDQFKEGKRTIRAELRACFTVTRPTAFCTITGL
jgi:HK97 family phage major capsid protein